MIVWILETPEEEEAETPAEYDWTFRGEGTEPDNDDPMSGLVFL